MKLRLRPDAEHVLAADPQVGDLVQPLGRIDDAAVGDAQGVHTSALVPSLLSCRLAGEQIEHGHSHRHSVGYLLENGRMRAVGDLRRNLHAAIDRTGRQKENVRFGPPQSLAVHAEQAERTH